MLSRFCSSAGRADGLIFKAHDFQSLSRLRLDIAVQLSGGAHQNLFGRMDRGRQRELQEVDALDRGILSASLHSEACLSSGTR